MSKFHVNDSGDPGPCGANIQCPFGGDAQHYPTPEIARQAFELSMASENVPKLSKKSESSEILVKDASSSKPKVVGLSSQEEIAKMKDEEDRVKALKANGYPKTSALDPRKKPGMEDRLPKKDKRRDYGHGRAVLPTGDRVNPHLNPDSNSYIEEWKKSGNQSMIAIVKQRGYNSDVYRSILSGQNGVSNDIIGDAFPMEHDQTGAIIGNGRWVVVGVYEPKPGGAVVGEIPNQKMPFYVYK